MNSTARRGRERSDESRYRQTNIRSSSFHPPLDSIKKSRVAIERHSDNGESVGKISRCEYVPTAQISELITIVEAAKHLRANSETRMG